MLIKVNGNYSNEFYRLGFQTMPNQILASIAAKAKHFAPAGAKSYRILALVHRPPGEPTGYGHFDVAYYSTLEEGDCGLA